MNICWKGSRKNRNHSVYTTNSDLTGRLRVSSVIRKAVLGCDQLRISLQIIAPDSAIKNTPSRYLTTPFS